MAEQDGEGHTQLVQLRDCGNPWDTDGCLTGTPDIFSLPRPWARASHRDRNKARAVLVLCFYVVGRWVYIYKNSCVCRYHVNLYNDLGVLPYMQI